MKKEKSHGVQLLLRTVVRDPDGKIIEDSGEKPSKSFVIQFLEFIYGMMRDGTNYALDATAVDGSEDNIYHTGTSYDFNRCRHHFRLDAPINESLYGLVVGTGDTSPTNTDFKMQSQLTEGVGAGKITHGAVVVGTAQVVGANVDLEIERAFINNTGSTITVKEAGAYAFRDQTEFFDQQWYHCIIRDVLPAPIDVPDKCSLTVYYTYRTTV